MRISQRDVDEALYTLKNTDKRAPSPPAEKRKSARKLDFNGFPAQKERDTLDLCELVDLINAAPKPQIKFKLVKKISYLSTVSTSAFVMDSVFGLQPYPSPPTK